MASPGWKYDAFINFRGADTRYNFTSHLHDKLRERGIRAYIDEEDIARGDDITPVLMEAISGSMFAIVIFSPRYSESSYCLDELVHILESKRRRNQTVIPIFYGVDPSEVQELEGEFNTKLLVLEDGLKKDYSKLEAFRNAVSGSVDLNPHKREFLQKHNERVRNWRNALKQVSGLAGWDPYVVRDEAALVRKIVDEISCKLNRVHPQIMKEGLVGMDDREKAVKDMLRLDADDDAVITVGICGVDGLGKTTIARVVYDSIRSSFKFDSSCFLADVGENYEKYGPCFLQEQLILETAEPVKIWTPDIGTAEIKYRLQIKKILLVLDDVSSLKQLKVLAADPSWFGKGTRIIITCRDEHLLRAYGVNREYIYKPETLSYDESLALFCSKAFKQTPSDENYLELCYQALDYAQGFPLALERLGSFLCGKDLMEWRSALRRLKGIPNIEIMDDPDDTPKTEIMNVLRRSYDGLNELEKQIFLDIACFFKGMNKDQVLDSSGFHSKIGLQVLMDKSLITESSGKLLMHDLVQQMGHEIVRQESCKDPGRHIRLWKYEDFRKVMINNKQSDAVEDIFLYLHSTAFSNMKRLSLSISGPITLHNALKFLEWDGFSNRHYGNFWPWTLVRLSLADCNLADATIPYNLLTQLWSLEHLDLRGNLMRRLSNDIKSLTKLQNLLLDRCRNLISLPELPESLDLLSVRDCTSLVVQSPFFFLVNQSHPMLRCSLLDFTFNYRTNPFGFYLSRSSYIEYPCETFFSLNVLERVERGSLEKLKLLLRLKKTGIVGFSIFKAEASHQNFQSECQKTKQICAIPESFVSVESITSPINILPCDLLELDLKDCNISDDHAILKNFSSLVFLKHLNLTGNLISRLPESIKGLAELRTLKLSRCKKLQSLPELPVGLEELKLYCCSSLKKVVNLPNLFVSLKLDVRNCDNLVEVQELFILKPMENIDVQTICDVSLLHGKFSEGIEVQMFNFMTYSMRKTSLQILHECGIVSVYLPGGKVPYWFSYNMEGSSSLVLTVPPSIIGDKIWSLNLYVVYGLLCTPENNSLPLLMARVCDKTKGLKWIYCPTVIGIPSESETMLWFSRWNFKHQLESGDQVVISFAYSAEFWIKQFGVEFVCGDEDVDIVSNKEPTVKGSSLYNQSLHDDDIFVYKVKQAADVQGASYLLSNHHYPASPDKFWLDQFLHSHPDFI